MANDTIYVANLKASDKFGNSILQGAICIDDLQEILQREDVQSLTYEYEGKTYLNIQVVERKKPDNFGKTHYVKIDDFVPDSSKSKDASTKTGDSKKTAKASKDKAK